MPHYQRVGDVPPKRTPSSAPDGLYAEELMGSDGFSSASSLLYHRRPPTAIVGADQVGQRRRPAATQRAAAPPPPPHRRAGRATTWSPGATCSSATTMCACPWPGRPAQRPLPQRDRRRDRLPARGTPAWSRRSARSTAVPATTWSSPPAPPTAGCPSPANRSTHPGHRGPRPRGAAARYLSATGQFLEHSPYCEQDLHGPKAPLVAGDGGEPVEVLVRQRGGGLTLYRYAHHPFDVVGWDGCLYPHRLSIYDFEPVTGRVHQPPPVHKTFAGPQLRGVQLRAPQARLPPPGGAGPYNHANVDSDEVLYYCEGDFTSRRGAGIAAGSISLHPRASSTGPSRAASRPRWAPRPPTSWRSWSTPSGPWAWAMLPWPARTPTIPGPGPASQPATVLVQAAVDHRRVLQRALVGDAAHHHQRVLDAGGGVGPDLPVEQGRDRRSRSSSRASTASSLQPSAR